MKQLSTTAILALGVGLIIGLGLGGRIADAHDIGWIYNKTAISIWHGNVNYSSQVVSASSDYDYNTDLTIDYSGTCTDYCHIIFNQANYGTGTSIARADPRDSAGRECALGYCNTTTNKADHGYVWLNTAYYPLANPDFVMRHELGHHFGLAHVECSPASVMKTYTACTSPWYAELQPHDISDINYWY